MFRICLLTVALVGMMVASAEATNGRFRRIIVERRPVVRERIVIERRPIVVERRPIVVERQEFFVDPHIQRSRAFFFFGH